MIPLHRDRHFTFRFADDRIIPRFHLEGVGDGRRISVFKLDPATGERLGRIATATVGDGRRAIRSPRFITEPRTGDGPRRRAGLA